MDGFREFLRQPAPPPQQSRLAAFVSSGFFFMLVGTAFLGIAFFTMGQTHSAMSFVFVVVGVAILLFGTGTQGFGQFDSGQNQSAVAKYKVAMAGGAGVLAFCVAAGIVGFTQQIKNAFQIEQRYIRLHIKGKGYQDNDIGRYVPNVRINGNPVPAVRRGDFIEVYAPYIQSNKPVRFEIRATLHLVENQPDLHPLPDGSFVVELHNDGKVTEEPDRPDKRDGQYHADSSYDFPWYRLQKLIQLENTQSQSVAGVTPR